MAYRHAAAGGSDLPHGEGVKGWPTFTGRRTDTPAPPSCFSWGANAAGRDDADVVNLGNALSRAGFVVMIHWSPTMGLQANVDPEEVENLVWAFKYLREQDYVDPERVGMGGVSVGGSFVMVAASDHRINDEVLFINPFGGLL